MSSVLDVSTCISLAKSFLVVAHLKERHTHHESSHKSMTHELFTHHFYAEHALNHFMFCSCIESALIMSDWFKWLRSAWIPYVYERFSRGEHRDCTDCDSGFQLIRGQPARHSQLLEVLCSEERLVASRSTSLSALFGRQQNSFKNSEMCSS